VPPRPLKVCASDGAVPRQPEAAAITADPMQRQTRKLDGIVLLLWYCSIFMESFILILRFAIDRKLRR